MGRARLGHGVIGLMMVAACTGPTVGSEVDDDGGTDTSTPDSTTDSVVPIDSTTDAADTFDALDTSDTTDTSDTGVPDTADTADTLEAGDACVDPTGFAGKACWKCEPTSWEQLENACTGAACVPFDNTKLGLDGGLPPLPSGDAGTDAADAADATADATADVTDSADSTVDASDAGADTTPDATADTSDAATDATDASDATDTADAPPPPPKCSSLSGGNVVYLTGASAVTAFIGILAQSLENNATPLSVVYVTQGSCLGVNAALNPSTALLKGKGTYWTADTAVDPSSAAAQLTCTLDSAGVQADIGVSDVFATSCFDLPSGLPSGLSDFYGPVQTFGFVVPKLSSATSISAEAAYLVYGFGGASYPVAPWTDSNFIFQRFATSGPQTLIGAAIGLPPAKWQGQVQSGSAPMRDSLIAADLAGAATSAKALGILTADFADDYRDKLQFLSFQDHGQRCGFLPDSNATTFDRKNVRDGHYPLWGPLHLIAHVDGAGRPTTNVQRFVNVVNGVETLTGIDIVGLYAARHLVPSCAMRVARDADGGALRSVKPTKGCGCYFEEKANGVASSSCTPCTVIGDCKSTAAPNCNKFGGSATGYCEP